MSVTRNPLRKVRWSDPGTSLDAAVNLHNSGRDVDQFILFMILLRKMEFGAFLGIATLGPTGLMMDLADRLWCNNAILERMHKKVSDLVKMGWVIRGGCRRNPTGEWALRIYESQTKRDEHEATPDGAIIKLAWEAKLEADGLTEEEYITRNFGMITVDGRPFPRRTLRSSAPCPHCAGSGRIPQIPVAAVAESSPTTLGEDIVRREQQWRTNGQ